jgi:hypothetical protein
MVFLAFISVKFETSKFNRVHVCVKIESLLYKICLFIIIQEIIVPNTLRA